MAGPDIPPLTFANVGRHLLMSIPIPVMVLMRETASAPDAAAASAVGRTSPLFGESLTIKGSVVTRHTDALIIATVCASAQKTSPPASTSRQDTFTSMQDTPSTPSR